MTPARLRRRYALDQRIARLTRKKGHRPFTKCCSALSEINPQNTAFGRKQLSGHILLPRYQKTGVRAAYSPSASLCACSAHSEINPQNTAFGRKRLSGHILLSRYQKTGVHAAGF